MKRYFFLVVLVLLAYVATIAVTQAAGPAPVDQTKLQQIKPGITTESEVRSLLGEPTSAKDVIVPLHGGHELVHNKILVYGPEGSEVSIYINNNNGKVYQILK
jgi:SmpA/OmlA family protein